MKYNPHWHFVGRKLLTFSWFENSYIMVVKWQINKFSHRQPLKYYLQVSQKWMLFLVCARFSKILQNFSERQILWRMFLVVFRALTLRLPIHTSLSVAPKLPAYTRSGEKCQNFSKTSTPQQGLWRQNLNRLFVFWKLDCSPWQPLVLSLASPGSCSSDVSRHLHLASTHCALGPQSSLVWHSVRPER